MTTKGLIMKTNLKLAPMPLEGRGDKRKELLAKAIIIRYISPDLDFIESGSTPRRKLKNLLGKLGCFEERRYFGHTETGFFLEFPTGPLAVGPRAGGKNDIKEVERWSKAGNKLAQFQEIKHRLDPPASFPPHETPKN
jgi:hypothetical protein